MSKTNTATAAAEIKESSLRMEVDRDQMMEELQLLQPLAGTSTFPITRNILIDATQPGLITLIGSNLETGIETQIAPTGLISTGKATVSANDLLKIVKTAPSGNILFSMKKQVLKIQFNSTNFELATLPADEYPSLPKLKDTRKKIQLPATTLKESIAQIIFAIAADDLRYAMNGALLRVDGNRITLVGTDGHRLSYVSRQSEEKLTQEVLEVLIPRPALEQLTKMLAHQKEEMIDLAVDNTYAMITVNARTLLFRLIESQFPNFEKFIAIRNKNVAIFQTDQFRNCLEKVTTIAESRQKSASFQLAQNTAIIAWSGTEGNKAESRVETKYEGESSSISFNASYILEFLHAVKSKEVRLELNNETTAAILKPNDENFNEYKYVVMPMRI
jgi:DNA polymerase-3 subunit beta